MWHQFYLIGRIHIGIIDTDLDRVSFAIGGWDLDFAGEILCFVLVQRCECDGSSSALELSPSVSKTKRSFVICYEFYRLLQ